MKSFQQKTVLTLYIVLSLMGCSEVENTDKLKQEIMDADRNFSKMASKEGIAAAFIYYADEHVIKPSSGKQPIVGKFQLMESFKKDPATNYKLTWEPLRAEASGNIGYTFGGYTLITKTSNGRDTTMYGNYVSIWKRKKDGSWRYVLDTGNSTPGPVVLK